MDNSTILKFLCIIGIQICFDQQNGCLNIFGAISWIFCAMSSVNPSFSKSALSFPLQPMQASWILLFVAFFDKSFKYSRASTLIIS